MSSRGSRLALFLSLSLQSLVSTYLFLLFFFSCPIYAMSSFSLHRSGSPRCLRRLPLPDFSLAVVLKVLSDFTPPHCEPLKVLDLLALLRKGVNLPFFLLTFLVVIIIILSSRSGPRPLQESRQEL